MNYERPVIGDERLALLDHREGRGRRRIAILAALGVLAAILVGWFALGGKKAPPPPPAAQGPAITVTVPGRRTVDRTITATGSLAAKRDMPVGVAGEGGEVRQVLVEPGQWVKAGQVLATVDRSVQAQTAASLAAAVTVARSDRDIAQSELERAQSLVDKGFIAKADLQRKAATRDAAAARVAVAQAQLAQQRASNGRLDIRAPAAGLVLTRAVEAGQIVGAGSGTLFRIAENGELELRAALAESDLVGLHVGARATVTPTGSTQSFPGTVWQVSPVVDPSTRQGVARIALPYNPALRPGGFATVAIVAGATVVPRLPESAVQSDDKGNFVYVLDHDDKVVRRNVKLGPVSQGGIAVIDGLNGSERVVVSAGAFLNPGQKVVPVMQRTAPAATNEG
jgi:RND family efflux transporter MFP subunit